LASDEIGGREGNIAAQPTDPFGKADTSGKNHEQEMYESGRGWVSRYVPPLPLPDPLL
jgi:hypothetical protein